MIDIFLPRGAIVECLDRLGYGAKSRRKVMSSRLGLKRLNDPSLGINLRVFHFTA